MSFLGLPLFFWGAACLALAVVWVFIWPSDSVAGNTGGLGYFALRWGHAVCWLLLSVSCFVRGAGWAGPANIIALAALAVYLGFIGSVIASRA